MEIFRVIVICSFLMFNVVLGQDSKTARPMPAPLPPPVAPPGPPAISPPGPPSISPSVPPPAKDDVGLVEDFKPEPDNRVYPNASVLARVIPNGCLRDYGYGSIYCPNQCRKTGQNCCWCEECWNRVFGLTQTCSCCPRGYKCCPRSNVPPTIGRNQKCCPINSQCGPVGSNYCISSPVCPVGSQICPRPVKFVALYTPPVFQNCYNWIWPFRWFFDDEVQIRGITNGSIAQI